MQRFDEIEIEPGVVDDTAAPLPEANDDDAAPRMRRLFALLIDLSLFFALVLALSPLLPEPSDWRHVASLAGFVVVLSYYYFVGAWLLWGKTIGGAIFDVRVIAASDSAMSLRNATLRWAAVYLSLLTAGIGFLLAALPSRQSLPDRLSATRCIAA
ncbi:MAG: RDD family protein [Acidobacteria bacterium]|nr:RDD family protein [Acidobacteriota bacterium]MBV9476720.1 RDD family protein [Acidobacteriota bacterium]